MTSKLGTDGPSAGGRSLADGQPISTDILIPNTVQSINSLIKSIYSLIKHVYFTMHNCVLKFYRLHLIQCNQLIH